MLTATIDHKIYPSEQKIKSANNSNIDDKKSNNRLESVSIITQSQPSRAFFQGAKKLDSPSITAQLRDIFIVPLCKGRIKDFSLETELSRIDSFKDVVKNNDVIILSGNISEEDRWDRDNRQDIRSQFAIRDSLLRSGIQSTIIDLEDTSLFEKVTVGKKVIIDAHGDYCEDGKVPGMLDFLGVKYSGSESLPHAIGWNKVAFKNMLSGMGINTQNYFLAKDSDKNKEQASYPLILKPISSGSSFNMEIINNPEQLDIALSKIPNPDDFYLEEFFSGVPATVGVLDSTQGIIALDVIEAHVSGSDFYDTEAKYLKKTDYIPRNNNPLTEELKKVAESVYSKIGCSGLARVDFMVNNETGDYTVLEINTTPGLARGSNIELSAKYFGMPYDSLILELLKSSYTK